MSEQRQVLEEIVERGNPGEWLNVLQHEVTRANNAEASVEHFKSELSLSLAREQRTREALEKLEGYASDHAQIGQGLMNARWVRDVARDALSSVPDGEQR
jgi:hypothetical protein